MRRATHRHRSLAAALLISGLAVLTGAAARSAEGSESASAPVESTPRKVGDAVTPKQHLTPLINRIAKQHQLDPELVHALIAVESGYNVRAVSRAGALGLMQVLPKTARDYGIEDPEALFDPETNLRTGSKHLRRLLTRYRNISHALMAYNAGEGEFSDFRRDGIFAETRRYMIQVVETYWRLKGRQ